MTAAPPAISLCQGEAAPRPALGWALRAAPALAILAVWQTAASLTPQALLPAPTVVLAVLVEEAWHGPLLHHLGATLRRVGLCFALAMTLGSLMGVAMAATPRLNRWADPWLQLLLTMPAMVVAILAYVWLGLSEVAAVAAVTLAKLPTVVITLREGARARDRDLAEMARCFAFSRRNRLLHLVLPELLPFVLVAARSGLALVWKIVLLAELLGRSDGVGFQLNVYFQLFDIAHILAYVASFMVVVHVVEISVLAWMDRCVARWKR